ncbi:MAG: hypothetical protein RLZZ46_1766 [Bacteroidota bacterium]
MNFLAHLYLSRHSETLMVGNFIADTIKGNKWQEHSPEIASGIRMHRAIDHFIDHHPIARLTANRFKPLLGKYSGVLTDMCYDYFLASRWNQYHTDLLSDFAENVYQTMNQHQHLMSEHARRIFLHMKTHNWLCKYETLEGMGIILNMMSARIGHKAALHEAVSIIESEERAIEHEFFQFMNEAKSIFENGRIF